MARSLESHLSRVGRLWQRRNEAATLHPQPKRVRLDPLARAKRTIDEADEVAGTLAWLSRQGLTRQQIRVVLAVSALGGERDFADVAHQLGITRQGARDAYLRAWRKLSPGKAARDGLLGE